LLTHLTIKNYALIEDLSVSFSKGFSTITGETGAGKSIFLGGLSLVLGKRADLGSLRDKEKKCTIEAEFAIEKYGLLPFFNASDLDYEPITILRREIHPSGKSRAFVNDSPVTLDVLSALGQRLIDIHSQHQTLELTENEFQLKVIDALADNKKRISSYSEHLKVFQATQKRLSELQELKQEAEKEQDYHTFLLNELMAAPLQPGILETLEAEYEQLSNVETILEQLSKAHQLLVNEEIGIQALLGELKQITSKLSGYGPKYQNLSERIQSVFLELDDLSFEMESVQEQVEANPDLLAEVNQKLQLLYNLQKKHSAVSIEELISVREELTKKVASTEDLEHDIEEKEAIMKRTQASLEVLAEELHTKREAVVPELKTKLENALGHLGMPNATFQIALKKKAEYFTTGMDELTFQFSANRGTDFGPLKKVASGGELSRIMLAIKSILAHYEQLPTMMFDEIDTGVSGEISNNMGDIMLEMSQNMQVFSITHLPQVASKGDQHFKVYKEDDGLVTRTRMKKLSQEERVVELAEMLGGKDLSDSAMAHAKQLLN